MRAEKYVRAEVQKVLSSYPDWGGRKKRGLVGKERQITRGANFNRDLHLEIVRRNNTHRNARRREGVNA